MTRPKYDGSVLGFRSAPQALTWFANAIEDGVIVPSIDHSTVKVQTSATGPELAHGRLFVQAVRVKRISKALEALYHPPDDFGIGRAACLRVLFERTAGLTMIKAKRSCRVQTPGAELAEQLGVDVHTIRRIVRHGNAAIMWGLRGIAE